MLVSFLEGIFVGLGLEVHEDHPLGLEDVGLLASDEEGEALVFGIAHLNLAGRVGLNAIQLFVGIAGVLKGLTITTVCSRRGSRAEAELGCWWHPS